MRRRLAVVAAVLVVLALPACGGSDDSGATSGTTIELGPAATAVGGVAPTGFDTVGLKIRDAGGSVHSLCLWLADTTAKREQGLMSVTSLGGKDGMIFTFDQDSNEQFWMFQTVMPLSIAFFDQAGELVSSTDMVPCPGASNTCPSYPAAGPYRDAIEVPAGALGSLGIGPESAIVARGQCPA